MLGLVGLRRGQDEKRRLVVHLRGLLAAHFPSAGADASLLVQRQLTPMTLSSFSSSHQPVKSPRQSPHTLASVWPRPPTVATTGPSQASSSVVRAPRRRAKWERLTMTVPIAAVHFAGGYERLIDSL
jgi:hypothetical protein